MTHNLDAPLRARNHLPVPDHDSILVVPLGGTSRVGMNATLVGHAGRWILIDAGTTFAGADDGRAEEVGEAHGGTVEQIIPDFRAVSANMNRIDAIVLTHAHEDHIGALPALYRFEEAWPRLAKLPIYSTGYTQGLVRSKLEETGKQANLRTMQFRKPTRIGPFEIIPLQVTHSAPETCALAIRTKIGTIVLGSDMKLDPEPILGRPTDVSGMEYLGRNGVLAFLGDSTNAAHSGRSVSEGEVLRGLTQVMRGHQGRVVISTFASNLARVASIAQASRLTGRTLGASGRSILRNLDNGIQTRVLSKGGIRIAEPRILPRLRPEQVSLVCTGTQAENGSAMRRMADDLELNQGRRGALRLGPGDLIIHSARIIPGNEASVQAMFKTFRENGVTVMEAGTSGPAIHASGHARRDELADFYRMLKPRFAVPIHGHRELIEAHLDLASSMAGVEASLSPSEGEVLRIAPDGMSLVGRLNLGQLATVAVGGRNQGETKLIAWANAPCPGLTVSHGHQPPRGNGDRASAGRQRQSQPAPQARPADREPRPAQGRGPRRRGRSESAPPAPSPGMR